MGATEGKTRMEKLEKQQEAMMKENASLLKKLADEQENHKKAHQAHMDQMAQLMLLVVLADAEKKTEKGKEMVEVSGVKYQVLDLLGEGGFGKVYKAKAVDSDRVVAIKVMKNSPLIQKEVENEIRFLQIMKKIRVDPHPVIELYGHQTTSDQILISMELAERDLLSFWFEDMKDKTHEEKFAFGLIIIIYTLRALTFLEKLNIIHGDIKPQNLVIVPVNTSIAIKLIDFGTVEKMNTFRAAKTVGPDKPYTNFFAAPEFLRRPPPGSARRLHKKSDAWAAGVMFFVLFLERFPWENDHEYDDFVNDPKARDIVVPPIGGYKLIIELLLRKNPDERTSAKETLLQIKAHPVLGSIMKSIEDAFYPADDVCRMDISDEIREELGKIILIRLNK